MGKKNKVLFHVPVVDIEERRFWSRHPATQAFKRKKAYNRYQAKKEIQEYLNESTELRHTAT